MLKHTLCAIALFSMTFFTVANAFAARTCQWYRPVEAVDSNGNPVQGWEPAGNYENPFTGATCIGTCGRGYSCTEDGIAFGWFGHSCKCRKKAISDFPATGTVNPHSPAGADKLKKKLEEKVKGLEKNLGSVHELGLSEEDYTEEVTAIQSIIKYSESLIAVLDTKGFSGLSEKQQLEVLSVMTEPALLQDEEDKGSSCGGK